MDATARLYVAVITGTSSSSRRSSGVSFQSEASDEQLVFDFEDTDSGFGKPTLKFLAPDNSPSRRRSHVSSPPVSPLSTSSTPEYEVPHHRQRRISVPYFKPSKTEHRRQRSDTLIYSLTEDSDLGGISAKVKCQSVPMPGPSSCSWTEVNVEKSIGEKRDLLACTGSICGSFSSESALPWTDSDVESSPCKDFPSSLPCKGALSMLLADEVRQKPTLETAGLRDDEASQRPPGPCAKLLNFAEPVLLPRASGSSPSQMPEAAVSAELLPRQVLASDVLDGSHEEVATASS
ncbi:hypothetical protein CYMTET_33362, partial [Cymbomonas tetramitiformis]